MCPYFNTDTRSCQVYAGTKAPYTPTVSIPCTYKMKAAMLLGLIFVVGFCLSEAFLDDFDKDLQAKLAKQQKELEDRLAKKRKELEDRLAKQRKELEDRLAKQRKELQERLAKEAKERETKLAEMRKVLECLTKPNTSQAAENCLDEKHLKSCLDSIVPVYDIANNTHRDLMHGWQQRRRECPGFIGKNICMGSVRNECKDDFNRKLWTKDKTICQDIQTVKDCLQTKLEDNCLDHIVQSQLAYVDKGCKVNTNDGNDFVWN